MGGSVLTLRLANLEDATFLLQIRNDAETRRWSTVTEVISAEEHARWMVRMLGDASRQAYVATLGGVAVGAGAVVRKSDELAEISFGLAPEARDRDLGGQLVAALVAQAFLRGYKAVRAVTDVHNARARRCLEANGLRLSRQWAEYRR